MITTRIDTSPEHLKHLLREIDLTTDQLATEAGVHRTSAYAWTSGRAQIPVSVIRMLEMMIEKKENNTTLRVKAKTAE